MSRNILSLRNKRPRNVIYVGSKIECPKNILFCSFLSFCHWKGLVSGLFMLCSTSEWNKKNLQKSIFEKSQQVFVKTSLEHFKLFCNGQRYVCWTTFSWHIKVLCKISTAEKKKQLRLTLVLTNLPKKKSKERRKD